MKPDWLLNTNRKKISALLLRQRQVSNKVDFLLICWSIKCSFRVGMLRRHGLWKNWAQNLHLWLWSERITNLCSCSCLHWSSNQTMYTISGHTLGVSHMSCDSHKQNINYLKCWISLRQGEYRMCCASLTPADDEHRMFGFLKTLQKVQSNSLFCLGRVITVWNDPEVLT